MGRVASLALALVLGLGACASAPPIEVANHGDPSWAERGHTFQVIVSKVGEHETELAAALTRRLVEAHLAPTKSSPDLLVEGVYSDRPGVVGAYGDEPKSKDVAWVDKPRSPSWWGGAPAELQSVGVVLIDARSGQEVYRGRATRTLDPRAAPDVTGLVDAALGRVPDAPRG